MNVAPSTPNEASGTARIAAAFAAAAGQGRAALMPYYTLGYPSCESSTRIINAIADAGADLIELGVPFSDPLADGPAIQHSTQVALQDGMTVTGCLAAVTRLRANGVRQPFVLMGYVNPILAYGMERFVSDAAVAGVDGFIVPDLPIEEAGPLEACCRSHELALVFLVAPTSTEKRIAEVAAHSTGFLYLVSVTGVTGARSELPGDLTAFVARAREATTLPLAVGFGIATREQVQEVSKLADGVIVGSALIRAVEGAVDPTEAGRAFVERLR